MKVYIGLLDGEAVSNRYLVIANVRWYMQRIFCDDNDPLTLDLYFCFWHRFMADALDVSWVLRCCCLYFI